MHSCNIGGYSGLREQERPIHRLQRPVLVEMPVYVGKFTWKSPCVGSLLLYVGAQCLATECNCMHWKSKVGCGQCFCHQTLVWTVLALCSLLLRWERLNYLGCAVLQFPLWEVDESIEMWW